MRAQVMSQLPADVANSSKYAGAGLQLAGDPESRSKGAAVLLGGTGASGKEVRVSACLPTRLPGCGGVGQAHASRTCPARMLPPARTHA